jgi:two-component system, OmpR family, copper resistance phosphate regulon response regulator CusR
MRLLIIEDEIRLADYLKKGLIENGFVVDIARDGIDGKHLATEGVYDVILLDVMLPGIDGFGILSALREKNRTPVIMLTARDKVEDRVRGLQNGADDYLVKPFSFTELLARIQALLRRSSNSTQQEATTLLLGDLELDLASRKVKRASQRLDLSAKEFNLLVLLLRKKGQVLSRTVLAEQVWDMNFDSDTNVVDVAVRRLRAKLDDPFAEKLLHTVRGMGYVLDNKAISGS